MRQVGCRKTGDWSARTSQAGTAQIRFGKVGAGEGCVIERGLAEIGGRKLRLVGARVPEIAAVPFDRLKSGQSAK